MHTLVEAAATRVVEFGMKVTVVWTTLATVDAEPDVVLRELESDSAVLDGEIASCM
jgi:hypothetical protein